MILYFLSVLFMSSISLHISHYKQQISIAHQHQTLTSDHLKILPQIPLSQVEMIDEISKRIMNDTQVKKYLQSNNKQSEQFKKLIFSKMITQMRTNITILKQLSRRIFQSSPYNMSQNQEQQFLQAILNDEKLVQVLQKNKQNSEDGKKQILKRGVQMYKNNLVLLKSMANLIYQKANITLTEDEKSQLFKTFLQNEKIMTSENKFNDTEIQQIINNIKKNQKLKNISQDNILKIKIFIKTL